MTVACLDLYETTYDVSWFTKAVQLSKEINSLFRDEDGPYYDTGIDAEVLLTRNAEGSDSAEPSGNSSVIYSFLKLQAYGLPKHYYKDAHRICKSFASHLKKFGISHPAMLSGLHLALSDSKEIVISGKRGEKETELLLEEIRLEYHPNIVVCFLENGENSEIEKIIPLSYNRRMLKDKATAYVCQNQTCLKPVHSVKELRELLN